MNTEAWRSETCRVHTASKLESHLQDEASGLSEAPLLVTPFHHWMNPESSFSKGTATLLSLKPLPGQVGCELPSCVRPLLPEEQVTISAQPQALVESNLVFLPDPRDDFWRPDYHLAGDVGSRTVLREMTQEGREEREWTLTGPIPRGFTHHPIEPAH